MFRSNDRRNSNTVSTKPLDAPNALHTPSVVAVVVAFSFIVVCSYLDMTTLKLLIIILLLGGNVRATH